MPRRNERGRRRDYDRNSTLISTKSVPGGSVALIIRPVRGIGRQSAGERAERQSLLSPEDGRSIAGTPQAARRTHNPLSPEVSQFSKDKTWKYQKV